MPTVSYLPDKVPDERTKRRIYA